MKPAPGKTAAHWLLRELLRRVICSRCVGKGDLYDRCESSGTRAGIAAHLGLWP